MGAGLKTGWWGKKCQGVKERTTMSCGLWQNPQSCVASRIGDIRNHCQDTVLPHWFLYAVFQNHLALQSDYRIAISCIVAQSCNGFIGRRQLALANIFRCKNNFVEQLCLRLSSWKQNDRRLPGRKYLAVCWICLRVPVNHAMMQIDRLL